jgi:hypothetical protein
MGLEDPDSAGDGWRQRRHGCVAHAARRSAFRYRRLLRTPCREAIRGKHPRTAGWDEQITNQTENYRREEVAGQGQTNFDAPHNSLPAADRVQVYCYYYLQMHAASTLYVYDQAMYHSGLGLAPHTVFVDFGSGPLTLPLGLVWLQHLRLVQDEPPPRLRLYYIGIEESDSMAERAKDFLEHSGLFHHGSTFRFTRSFLPAPSLCGEIDALLPPSDGIKSDIVLNMSYFIASASVTIEDLVTAVQAILARYRSRRIWIVFQNPCRHSSQSKWDHFKENISKLRPVSSGEEVIGYTNSTNRKGTWRTHLCHEVLVRDPVGAADSVPRTAAPQGAPTCVQPSRSASPPPPASASEDDVPL